MTDEASNSEAPQPPSTPHPGLKRFDRLVGTWTMEGHTLDSKDYNITGRVTIKWLPGGYFLEQRGEMEFNDFKAYSLEILSYEATTESYTATVYSNMDSRPARYFWNLEGDTLTHWTKRSKYTGTFSADGNTITGGWRPDEGQASDENVAYDVVMRRVEE